MFITATPRADVDIMVNGSMLCRVTSPVPNDVGSCQGIRHMAAGDQAWVQAYNGTNTFKANASSFTGFLLAGSCTGFTDQLMNILCVKRIVLI